MVRNVSLGLCKKSLIRLFARPSSQELDLGLLRLEAQCMEGYRNYSVKFAQVVPKLCRA